MENENAAARAGTLGSGLDIYGNHRNPNAAAMPAAMTLDYVGKSDSLIVHGTECDYAEQMAVEHRIWFSELYDALGQGYRECRWCLTEGL
jgi:hypothetical protein